jgi:hypothetical protein
MKKKFTSNFMFTGFTKLDETSKEKPKRRARKKKHKKPDTIPEEDGITKGKRIPLTGFVIELINDTIRDNIKSYYRKNKNIIPWSIKSDSVRVAEKLIEDNLNDKLKELLATATEVSHSMTFKGWNITLHSLTLENKPKLSITCIFKANYIRRYNITIITEHDCYNVYSNQIACEKTIYREDNKENNLIKSSKNIENDGKQD